MGNDCCCDNTTSTTEFEKVRNHNDNNKPQSQEEIAYIDSDGKPVPNAIKRYVKPPTTVGRQSVIMRGLRNNEDVPDWIWANENNQILNSGATNDYFRKNPQYDPRKTYEEINGRFQGQQTVNLSKLQYQNMGGSQRVHPGNQNPTNIYLSAQPVPHHSNFHHSTSFGGVPQGSQQSANNQEKTLKRTQSGEIPFVTSVNGNDSNYPEMKKTNSNSNLVNVSPFQMISQNQGSLNQGNKSNFNVPNSAFISNSVSVNNSIQQPQYRQVYGGRQ